MVCTSCKLNERTGLKRESWSATAEIWAAQVSRVLVRGGSKSVGERSFKVRKMLKAKLMTMNWKYVSDGLIAVLQVDTYGFGNSVKKIFWGLSFLGDQMQKRGVSFWMKTCCSLFLSQSARNDVKSNVQLFPLGECQIEIYVIRQSAYQRGVAT